MVLVVIWYAPTVTVNWVPTFVWMVPTVALTSVTAGCAEPCGTATTDNIGNRPPLAVSTAAGLNWVVMFQYASRVTMLTGKGVPITTAGGALTIRAAIGPGLTVTLATACAAPAEAVNWTAPATVN